MNKKHLLLIGLLLVITTFVFAEKEEVATPAYIEFNHSLGFQTGDISGSGLSYQTWMTKNISLMTSFGAFYSPLDDTSYDNENVLNYSLGEEFQCRVYGADYDNWFSAQLYTFWGLNHSGDIAVVETAGSYTTGPYAPHFTLGAGIGIEVIVFRHISMPVEVGYSATWSPLAGDFAEQFSIDLVPQIGFRYRY